MIYILFGEDDFTRDETLISMKRVSTDSNIGDVNVTTLEATQISLDELINICNTIPFLADKRIVVVRGLFSLLGSHTTRKARSLKSSKSGKSQDLWVNLGEHLSSIPDTTELIFVEGHINQQNILFSEIRKLAKVLSFPMPQKNEVDDWIQNRATSYGVNIDKKAIIALSETIGRNLRIIDSELQKLSLYCHGRTIEQEDVLELVASAREANIFTAIDAILEKRTGLGVRLVRKLLESASTPSYVITMIARQVRLLILVKNLKLQGIPADSIGKRIGLSGYPLKKTLHQEKRFSVHQLSSIHKELLQTDTLIKTHSIDDQILLDMLIVDLSSK